MMVTTGIKLIISLLFVGALYTTDATITAWTEPAVSTISGTASTGYTFAEDIATGTAGVSKTFVVTGEGTVTFTLLTAGTPFSVATDGVLTLDTALDFETTPTYSLQVQAVDTTNPTTGTASIAVTVTNANEAPAFAKAAYNVNIADGSTAGTSVTTVSATDVDDGDTVAYTITSGNDNTDFEMDASTGVITVSNGKTLAADTLAAYTLIVTATDAGSLTATATVSIAVKKDGATSGDGTDTGTAPIVNKSDPVFSASSFSPCIADKSPAGTTLTTVTATVKDTSDTFTYAIASGDPGKNFTIDPNSGLIQVNVGKTLDKAATPSYSLVVTAADKVVTTKTGTTTVSVTVADSCDSGTAVASVSVMMLIVSLFMTLF